MLVSEFTKIKWNSKIKKHYVDLGYTFTKMKDEFCVNVKDLTNGSSAIVLVKCDYCGNIFQIHWSSYYKLKQKDNNSDCCGNPECTGRKAKESIIKKYNVDNVRKLDFVNEKIKNTNIERYGCENPFGNKNIQEKIRQYNIDNYGVEYSMQRKDVVEKSQKTCIEKYGVINYGKIYSETHTKELSPTWKNSVSHERTERKSLEYRQWRKEVFDRDLYTCQCCGARNGNGKYIVLNAHHIFNWKDNYDLRLSIDNGITLCNKCHNSFHSIYGKTNNTRKQLNEFLEDYKLDKNIC